MSKLTNTQIKNAKPKDKPYMLSDGLGLSLLIKSSGSKLWRYRFRFDGKAKMMGLGKYPDVSLANARERLKECRELVAGGINPIEQNQQHKAEEEHNESRMSLNEAADLYLDHIQPDVSSHHYKRSESLLRLYVRPVIGDTPIEEVTHQDLQRIITNLSNTGKKANAEKLNSVLSKLFSYAKINGFCETNVHRLVETSGLFVSAASKHHPTITEPHEVKALLDNIRSVENGHWSTKYALLFMALTALRSANVRQAKWSMVDFDNAVMTIPASEMKMKAIDKQRADDFKLPLAAQTIDLLDEVKRLSGHGKYIFPSIRGDRPM